jgi:copper chaperone CopZ
MIKTEILQNLKCDGCANTITNALNKIDGIKNAQVELQSNSVSFEYNDENQIDIVEKKLANLGYPIETDPNSILQKAKSFVSCAVGRISDKKDC